MLGFLRIAAVMFNTNITESLNQSNTLKHNCFNFYGTALHVINWSHWILQFSHSSTKDSCKLLKHTSWEHERHVCHSDNWTRSENHLHLCRFSDITSNTLRSASLHQVPSLFWKALGLNAPSLNKHRTGYRTPKANRLQEHICLCPSGLFFLIYCSSLWLCKQGEPVFGHNSPREPK